MALCTQSKPLIVLCVLNYALPLTLILIAIALSPWFSIWDNALSDLGHALKSSVAPLFNLALVVGGVLLIVLALKYMYSYYSKIRAIILLYAGFVLVLVGVYDEVYGFLHFIVSVLFFLGIIAYLIAIGIEEKSPYPVIVAVLQLIMWTLHLFYNIPPGAAIPELIAILSFIPFYTRDYIRIASTLCS